MNSPIDIKELHEIMDDDEELLRECFADFLEDCEEMLSSILVAINNNSPEELEKSAHAFKSTLKYLAASSAVEFASQLETMGRNGNIQEAAKSIANLSEECKRVKEFMANY